MHSSLRRLPILAAMAGVLGLFALACGGSNAETTPTLEAAIPSGTPTAAGATAEVAEYDFPTGEAVLVAADYAHPDDHVDNTGTYLPTNGKPTLVFVDAIW